MPVISVRCSQAEKDELEARSGGNVSAYVRHLVFGDHDPHSGLAHRLDDLREDILEALQGGQSGPAQVDSPGVPDWVAASVLEMLMMMRFQYKRDIRQQAMGEVERVGMVPFESETYLKQREENDG